MPSVAPLGLGGFCYPVCYKHIAPLGLRRKDLSSGYRHVAPLGLNAPNPLSRFTHHVLRSESPRPDSDNTPQLSLNT